MIVLPCYGFIIRKMASTPIRQSSSITTTTTTTNTTTSSSKSTSRLHTNNDSPCYGNTIADTEHNSNSPQLDRNVQFASISGFPGLGSPSSRPRTESTETPHKQKFDPTQEIHDYKDNFDLPKYLKIEILGNSVSDYNEVYIYIYIHVRAF